MAISNCQMQEGKASESDTITTITTTDDFQNSELKKLDIEDQVEN